MIFTRPYKIKNTALRRAVFIVAMPLAALYVAPLSVLAMPFRILWNMGREAARAAGEEWQATWETYPMRLLRTGFWWAWQDDFHTDQDGSLSRAKKRVHQ